MGKQGQSPTLADGLTAAMNKFTDDDTSETGVGSVNPAPEA